MTLLYGCFKRVSTTFRLLSRCRAVTCRISPFHSGPWPKGQSLIAEIEMGFAARTSFTVDSALTAAKKHFERGDIQQGCEKLYMRVVLAADKCAAKQKIRLATHRARRAFIQFIAGAEKDEQIKKTLPEAVPKVDKLHDWHYAGSEIISATDVDNAATTADALVQYLLDADFGSCFFMDHLKGFCANLGVKNRKPNEIENALGIPYEIVLYN